MIGHWHPQTTFWRTAWPLAAAAVLLLATYAQPHWAGERQLVEHIVVLDITESMNTQDMADGPTPLSRLAYAKRALAQALPQLPCGARLGWGVFTEHRSFLLTTPVEVCANRSELLRSLAYIDRRMAWSGNSEVAKGLHSGLKLSQSMASKPALIFVTDGHEAPPLDPRHRPRHDLEVGERRGLVVGVGGQALLPIPKTDALGHPIGRWSADDVLQFSPRSQGRGGSVKGEAMADAEPAARGDVVTALGGTPGREHLSSLREPYLRLLASELGLGYHRLGSVAELVRALQAPALTRPVAVRRDGRAALAAAALGLLLWPHAAWWRRRRRLRRAAAQLQPGA